MTLLEASVTILTGILTLLGGGAAVRWIDARRTITVRALDMVDHGREDTARHVTDWGECERRCGRLEGQLATALAESDALRARVAELEREVGLMRSAIDALLEGRDPSPRLLSAVTGGRIPRGRP